MKAIATALLNLTAFVELAGDDVIDPDASVDALEQLATDLEEAGPQERACLKKLIHEQMDAMPEDRDDEDRAKMTFFMELLDMLEEA